EPIFPPRRSSHGTWRCWTNPAWKRCARCFWKTCWRARRSAPRQEGCGIGGVDSGCSSGNPGNGQYRQELKQARALSATYAHALSFPLSHVVIRLDGLYGDAAPLADLFAAQAGEEEGPAVVVRGKAYHLIEQPAIQHRLQRPPDQVTVHPESVASRALYDCASIQLAPRGPMMRMLLATHPAGSSRPPIGKVREGTAYEQFFTTLPPYAFTPADVLDLYLHRGSFETVLADED